MKRFYFVGGPRAGQEAVFMAALRRVGGPPSGWTIYPHANGDGQALHVVEADDESCIDEHLDQFDGFYDRGPVIEVTLPPTSPR